MTATGAFLHPAGPTLRRGLAAAALAAVLLAPALPAAVEAAPRARADPASSKAPARPPATVVAVLGDGYGAALADGLRTDLASSPDTQVVPATHDPAGLADGSGYDWPKAAADLLGRQHVDVAVIMLGASDGAALPDGTTAAASSGPRWRALYGERVRALAETFRTAAVPVVWVGLPIVADEARSAAFSALNEIARDAATAAGATYVDAWAAFADENGRYDAFGPDAKGRTVRLRTADGNDLTAAGAVKLAGFVEAEIRALHPAAPHPETDEFVLTRQPGFDDPQNFDINAQIRREAGLPALPGVGPGKVERGPVIALTAPVLAEDGRLVAPLSGPAPLLGTNSTAAERALVEGLPIQPRAGRSDDFSWPHP